VYIRMGGVRQDVIVKLLGDNSLHLAQGLAHFAQATWATTRCTWRKASHTLTRPRPNASTSGTDRCCSQ
jgi:hypothetical protein